VPAVRVAWGRRGARAAAARGDLVVVVDVLSFSTAVATAVARGAAVHPCAPGTDVAAVARSLGAERAVGRADVPALGRFSLSPRTWAAATPGTRVVLASPNGATCAQVARDVPALWVGALVTASAVGRAVTAELAKRAGAGVTVLACGERWHDADPDDGTLRVALEDELGAGAIVAAIEAEKSAEARAYEAAFRAARAELGALLRGCASGLELTRRGFAHDVEDAGRLDAYDVAPLMRDGWIGAEEL
jgi:2-phosphosulfolactate phosphatase